MNGIVAFLVKLEGTSMQTGFVSLRRKTVTTTKVAYDVKNTLEPT